MNPLITVCLIAGLIATPSWSDQPPMRGLELFADYTIDINAGWFGLQKDSFYVERRYAQSISRCELTLLSYKQFHTVWWIQTHIGLGQTPGNVVFDVIDLDYSLCPTFEYRFTPAIVQTGIDHRCFHEVDRKILKVAYWNLVFLSIGSPSMRIGEFIETVKGSSGWNWRDRFSWRAQWGFFLKEFFGLVHQSKLNGMNERSHELSLSGRFAAFQKSDLLLALSGQSTLGRQANGTEPATYWQQRLGAEFHYIGGRAGAMLYVSWYRDDMPVQEGKPRWSMDRLLEVGIRVFN